MSMNAGWRNEPDGMRCGNQDSIRGLHEQIRPYVLEGAHDIEAATVRIPSPPILRAARPSEDRQRVSAKGCPRHADAGRLRVTALVRVLALSESPARPPPCGRLPRAPPPCRSTN